MVKGSDANTDRDPSPREGLNSQQRDGDVSGADSDGASAGASEHGSDGGDSDGSEPSRAQGANTKGRHRKAVETMSNMVSRVKVFMKVYLTTYGDL